MAELEIVELYLQYGAHVTTTDIGGGTALSYAIQYGACQHSQAVDTQDITRTGTAPNTHSSSYDSPHLRSHLVTEPSQTRLLLTKKLLFFPHFIKNMKIYYPKKLGFLK